MIRSFHDKNSILVFKREFSNKIPLEIHRIAHRKLLLIHAADSINNLRSPRGNRLELLKENRQGQYSIRINAKWRICFYWIENNAYKVEITDYH